MSNELATKNSNEIIRNIDDLGRIGKMMSASGYFIDARDAAQAGVKIMAGMEMGFGPFTSMTGIYIIKGRPSVGANLMASAVKANPKYDYRVKEHSNKVCKIEFFELIDGKRESIGVSEFTAEDAAAAGTQNMQKFAKNMLFARAMSNGIKWYCPDVFNGNPTYVPEELGAIVDGEGNVVSIDGEAPKTNAPVPEAQEAIVEAEIVEPINNTPAQEKPVEAPQKPKFDEKEYLRKYQHKAGLPPVNLEHALKIENSEGKPYGDMSVTELRGMTFGIQKKLETLESELEKKVYLQKLGAINTILTAKANAQRLAEMPKDPNIRKDDVEHTNWDNEVRNG